MYVYIVCLLPRAQCKLRDITNCMPTLVITRQSLLLSSVQVRLLFLGVISTLIPNFCLNYMSRLYYFFNGTRFRPYSFNGSVSVQNGEYVSVILIFSHGCTYFFEIWHDGSKPPCCGF
jgi:hypothetical protein